MTHSDYTTRVITADQGHWLTQNPQPDDPKGITLSTRVFLAANDTPDNWREITEEQAQALRDLIQQAVEEEHPQE